MTSPPTGKARYRRSRQLVEAAFGDEIVALDRGKGVCLSFNTVATDIWKMLASPVSVDEIVDGLTEAYEVDLAECRKSVQDSLAEFERLGLISIVSADDR